MDNLILHDRKIVTFYKDEETSLTFLKPNSGNWENHLIVIYEDAYGDFGGNIMHINAIKERYEISDAIINNILNRLKNGNNKN